MKSDFWTLVIVGGTPRLIARPFCRKGYGHAFAVQYNPVAGEWLIFDPHRNMTDIRILTERQITAVSHFIMAKGIAYEVQIKKPRSAYMPWPIYCVSQLRQLIGMNSLCFTPWGLIEAAIKEFPDGKFVFDTADRYQASKVS